MSDALGFRIATILRGMIEGRSDTGDREILPDDGEKDLILSYLKAGKILLRSTVRTQDVLDAAKGDVVPAIFRTDGIWIWPEAVSYYLDVHGVAPEPDFTEYIRSKGYVYEEPTRDQLHAASAALKADIGRAPLSRD